MSIESQLKDRILSEYKSLRAFTNAANIPYSTVDTMLKKGISGTGIGNMFKICRALDIDINELEKGKILKKEEATTVNDFTSHEISVVTSYRKLDAHGKKMVDITMAEELNRINSQTEAKIPVKFPVQYFSLGASAGTGNYLDYTISSIEYIDEEPPAGTDYMLKVTGDSMEPTYYDGDYVFVNRDEKPKFGEVGIFWYDGCVYIKEYGRDGLISHNPNYDIIKADNTMSCMGKVIGKIGE